jgi:hypothetical protein
MAEPTPSPENTSWSLSPLASRRLVIAFLAAALVIGVIAWQTEYKHDQASKSWPTTTGRIVASKAIPPVMDEGYDLEVFYEYQVDSKSYTSDRVSFGWLWKDVIPSEFAKEHPPDSVVTVYYDAQDPAISVLFPGAGSDGLAGTVSTSIVLALIMLFVIFVAKLAWRGLKLVAGFVT